MRGYYISLEPERKLKTAVIREKKRAKKMKGAEYADHPPHMTLCVFEKGLREMVKYLNKKDFHRIPFQIVGWKVYRNDVITGKDTLVCDVLDSYGLINSLYMFILSTTNAHSKNLYNFTDSAWEPHITIASVPALVYNTFKCPRGKWVMTSLTIRNRDTHKIIKEWELK